MLGGAFTYLAGTIYHKNLEIHADYKSIEKKYDKESHAQVVHSELAEIRGLDYANMIFEDYSN